VSKGCKDDGVAEAGGGLLGRGGGLWVLDSEGTVLLGGGGGESWRLFTGTGGRTESADLVRLSSTGLVLPSLGLSGGGLCCAGSGGGARYGGGGLVEDDCEVKGKAA